MASLLLVVPERGTEKLIDTRWLKFKLEAFGHTQPAQIVCWHKFDRIVEDWRRRDLEWSQKTNIADIQGRWIV